MVDGVINICAPWWIQCVIKQNILLITCFVLFIINSKENYPLFYNVKLHSYLLHMIYINLTLYNLRQGHKTVQVCRTSLMELYFTQR